MESSRALPNGSDLLKRVLVPFYVVRLAVLAFYFVTLIIALVFIGANDNKYFDLWRKYGHTSAFKLIAIYLALLLVVALCFILDIVCVVKRARRTLSLRFFLIVNIVQTAIWTALFVLTMLGPKNNMNIILNSIAYAAFIGLLIYASVAFHQNRVVKRYNSVAYEAPPAIANGSQHYEPYSHQISEVPLPPAVRQYEPYSYTNQSPGAPTRKPVASASDRLSDQGRYA